VETFKNIRKLSENIQKLSGNIRLFLDADCAEKKAQKTEVRSQKTEVRIWFDGLGNFGIINHGFHRFATEVTENTESK